MIKLILSDMDNTLIPIGSTRVSRRTIEAIHACLDAGIPFVPASGRNLVEAARFFGNDERCYQTAVFSNGQQVYLDGRLVFEKPLDDASLQEAERIVMRREGCQLISFRLEGGTDWVGAAREDLLPIFESTAPHKGHRRKTLADLTVVKAGIINMGDRNAELELLEELAAACPQLDFYNTTPHWLDVVPRGWSKAEAVRLFEERLGIGPEQICAFGDGENDIPLLERVGHPCAVANATDHVRKVARWHVGACADDGVACALERIACGLTPADA